MSLWLYGSKFLDKNLCGTNRPETTIATATKCSKRWLVWTGKLSVPLWRGPHFSRLPKLFLGFVSTEVSRSCQSGAGEVCLTLSPQWRIESSRSRTASHFFGLVVFLWIFVAYGVPWPENFCDRDTKFYVLDQSFYFFLIVVEHSSYFPFLASKN